MIDSLLDLTVFTRIVAGGSMSVAARELDLSLAVVSKRLAVLEERLGVQLLRRTTRRQSLTVEGVAFHERCIRILSEIQDAEMQITRSKEDVSGLLRITAPRGFGRQQLVAIAAAFQAQHPDLSVQLDLRDEFVDLVEAGIDVALRFGALRDSTMTARLIAPNYRVLCASPAYLARHGTPTHAAELASHQCITFGARPASHWLFQVDGQPVAVQVRGTFLTNDCDAAQALALEGAGIFFKSIWDVGADIDAGRLVRVMRNHASPTEPLHAVYPRAQYLSPRVRRFVDFAIVRLQEAWRWGEQP